MKMNWEKYKNIIKTFENLGASITAIEHRLANDEGLREVKLVDWVILYFLDSLDNQDAVKDIENALHNNVGGAFGEIFRDSYVTQDKIVINVDGPYEKEHVDDEYVTPVINYLEKLKPPIKVKTVMFFN